MATQLADDGLSPRERDVMRLVVAGKANKEIAAVLGMRLALLAVLLLVAGTVACNGSADPEPLRATASPSPTSPRPSNTPTVAPLGGGACQPDGTPSVSDRTRLGRFSGPFCLAWRDVWSDEVGFRIELAYIHADDSIERFDYTAPANTNEFVFPLADSPAHVNPEKCLDRKDYGVSLYVIRSSGEEFVDRRSVTEECPA